MAKKAKGEPKDEYEVLVGTVIDGELRRKGDVVQLGQGDARDLLAIKRIAERSTMDARRGRIAGRGPVYRRRDMVAEGE